MTARARGFIEPWYPRAETWELLDRISRAKYFTKMDVRDGYHRLRIATGEEWKTAFRCRYGLFEYTVMPFGLCNAPGTFQHYMNKTLIEYLDNFCTAYLDDILIYSENLLEHTEHVCKVLLQLCKAGLQADIKKCEFNVICTKYLGFVVSTDGIEVNPEKVEVICN